MVLIGLQSRWFKSSDLRTRRTVWGKRARLNYALNGLFSRACVLPRRRSYLKNGFLLYFHHSARVAYHATLRRHRLPQACVDEACIIFAIYTSPFNGAARLITAAITFAIQFNSISLATKTIVRTLVFTDVLTELTSSACEDYPEEQTQYACSCGRARLLARRFIDYGKPHPYEDNNAYLQAKSWCSSTRWRVKNGLAGLKTR